MSESGRVDKNSFVETRPRPYTGQMRGKGMIRHIDAELNALKDLALAMGARVEQALESACQSVLTGGEACRQETHRHEELINALQMEIDEACVNLLAKQAPVARDLRLVIAINRINTDLERMGDQSVNIVRSACELHANWPEAGLPAELTGMVDDVRGMVRSALDAFARRDVELSNQVLQLDDKVDGLRDVLFRDMIQRMKLGPEHVECGVAFIMIAKNLERLADHATNIAEEVIYLATGNDVRHGHSHGTDS